MSISAMTDLKLNNFIFKYFLRTFDAYIFPIYNIKFCHYFKLYKFIN